MKADMNKVAWHNGRKDEVIRFDPYLMQVLETRTPVVPRVTAAEAFASLSEKSDRLKCGLPLKVARYVDDLVSWHYMGACEYECGAIPNALFYLTSSVLAADTFTVEAKDLPRSFYRGNANYDARAQELEKLTRSKKQTEKKRARIAELTVAIEAGPTEDLVLHYLGPVEYEPFIAELPKRMAKGGQRNKNSARFSAIADPVDSSDQRMVGWCCLDYPFFLVKDKILADALAEVFVPAA